MLLLLIDLLFYLWVTHVFLISGNPSPGNKPRRLSEFPPLIHPIFPPGEGWGYQWGVGGY